MLIRFYLPWYLGRWRRRRLPARMTQPPRLEAILREVERTSRRLARAIFYAMALRRAALKDDQGRQNRIEEVGEELLTLAATALHAAAQDREGIRDGWDLLQEYARTARVRISRHLRELLSNDDEALAAVGRRALRGDYRALSSGIIRRSLDDYNKQ